MIKRWSNGDETADQKLIKKQQHCNFHDYLLRITKAYVIYTEKVTQCTYRPGEFITYGKILKGHDGFYHINYQYKKQPNDANIQKPYKITIHSSKLLNYTYPK